MEAPHHIIALAGFPQQPWCKSFSQSQWLLPLLLRSPQRDVQHLLCRVQESSSSYGESGILRTLPCKNHLPFRSDIKVPVPPAMRTQANRKKVDCEADETAALRWAFNKYSVLEDLSNFSESFP